MSAERVKISVIVGGSELMHASSTARLRLKINFYQLDFDKTVLMLQPDDSSASGRG